MTRTKKLLLTVGIVFVIVSLLLAYAYFIEPFRLVINRQEIYVDGWDPALDGMRFVLISDIHAGSHGSNAAQLQRMVKLANEEYADAIFLLGDHVAGATGDDMLYLPMPMDELASILSGLKARYGVIAVLGNHESFYSRDLATAALQNAGIIVLQDEVVILEKNGHRVRVLGMRDHRQFPTWQDASNSGKKALAPTEGTGNVIVLEHSPDVLPAITGDLLISPDLKLMFAGHTHGGQVRLPFIGAPIVPSSYGQKYAAGHVRDFGVDMFVTTGIGTTTLPFRFMVPPEIAVITVYSQ
ncbi:MAG: metallophosphoesterase [Pyrinomonadaceae bacterium]